ncbi:dephospho-CoA kinase [uncultured Aquimonas sp.]|uniref:dephospho-CoA kinase n=1 Tax=uncultured Aquimonas sp. TaxID=385483 RepID=UPI00086978B9|nr:dephospho-CoA kinase [uncultured Aquimonas sp.]ODU45007.1 MAG: dephospho-CoA kinase [Xanthomonadaceae bacterium SCN 69-123]
MRASPYIVAVTGGIASGKSAVTARFEQLGVPVIDADLIARELVEPGEAALGEIVQRFGAGVLDAEGRLDRRQLRQHIFSDAGARGDLEAILHPRIRERMRARARAAAAPYVVLAIPLLTAGSRYPFIDRVLVVDVPEAQQIERLTRRDGVDETGARAALAAQIGRTERRALADDVVDNSGSLASLAAAVDALHARYLDLAAAR